MYKAKYTKENGQIHKHKHYLNEHTSEQTKLVKIEIWRTQLTNLT